MTEYDSVDELLEYYRRQDRPIRITVCKSKAGLPEGKPIAKQIARHVLGDGYGTIPGDTVEYPNPAFIDMTTIPARELQQTILQSLEHPNAPRDIVIYVYGPDHESEEVADIIVDISDEVTCYAVEAVDDPANPRTVLRKIDYPDEWGEDDD